MICPIKPAAAAGSSGIDTEYGVIRTDGGARLRTVTAAARMEDCPPSCSYRGCPVIPSTSGEQYRRLVAHAQAAITQSNMLWERVDKSGGGDSTCTPALSWITTPS